MPPNNGTSTVRPALADRADIIAAITAAQGVADVSVLREAMLARVSRPGDWQARNRREHMRSFAPFFDRLLDPNSSNPRIRELMGALARIALAGQGGWEEPPLRPAPVGLDPRLNDPTDLLGAVFEIIFGEAVLLQQWMAELDSHAEQISGGTLQAMDEAAMAGLSPLRRDIVLVGGGPLSSIIASLLGAFFHVTVITASRALGFPWRRRPIFINSSCTSADFFGISLPLLQGTTTRVIGSQLWNFLDATLALLSGDVKRVFCDNGTIADYAAGPPLGDLIATDILLGADEFLLNQFCDVTQMAPLPDGSVQLCLVDTRDGTRRVLQASAVFLCTGPAQEETKVRDLATQQLYRDAAAQLTGRLRLARQRLAYYNAPGLQGNPGTLSSLRALIVGDLELPAVLSLTMIEELYEFWVFDLGADPAAYPLKALLREAHTVGYVGNGDTMRTLKEFDEQIGPDCALPAGWQRTPSRHRATIYNEASASAVEYALANRRRYLGIFTPGTKTVPFKVSRYRLLTDKRGRRRVEVTYRDEAGKRHRNRFDYIYDATGLSRRRIEDGLPAAFRMYDVRDQQGYVVARGDLAYSLFIVGVATGFRGADFASEIQAIIAALDLGENVQSLWANGTLGERFAYTYLLTHPFTKQAPVPVPA